MNDAWVRFEAVEDAFNELHGVKPQVYRLVPYTNTIKHKIIFSGKEILLTEVLDKGLTKEAILEYNGNISSFGKVIDAEKAAVSILRG